MDGMGTERAGKWARVWRYEGKRGVVWRIRYRDAGGRRVLETLGREPQWNRKRAETELRRRLVDVERSGYTRPQELTFAEFSERWLTEYLPGRGLKLTTTDGYRQALKCHLLPYFGRYRLSELESLASTKSGDCSPFWLPQFRRAAGSSRSVRASASEPPGSAQDWSAGPTSK